MTTNNTSVATAIESTEQIRSFKVNFPEKDLVDLKRRILATRFPEKETVSDQ
jgi:hypothetical protein